MILVTGATGTVGGALVGALSRGQVPVRALVRSPERGDDLRGYDCELAIGDFADPASLRRAVRGVEAVFLISPISPEQPAWEGAVLDAAAAAPTPPRVVKVAALGYEELPGLIGENHRQIVSQLRASGLAHTVLAPNAFFQNLLGAAAALSTGRWPTPGGAAPVSMIDARDVADVAAHLLQTGGHEGASYELTGPAALSGDQVCTAISAALDRPVRRVALSAPEFTETLAAAGTAAPLAPALLALYAWQDGGAAAAVTDEVTRATGRPARSLAAFLGDHRSAFRAA